jgi:ATP-dependent helicase/nuclease subunit A
VIGKPRVEIIAASAGSGKTHRLATTFLEEVAEERVRPEAVVAVTFTVKAAAELEERVRSYLVRERRTAEAQRLGAARIGTVHGVCARLLSEFAFELGLSPRQIVLDSKAAAVALGEALESAMTPERARRAAALGSRMHDFHVRQVAQELIKLARINAIPAEELRKCAPRSWQGLQALLGAPLDSGPRMEGDLLAALEAFERDSPEADRTKATTKARRVVGTALNRLRSGRSPKWADWARLAKLGTGKQSRPAAEAVRQSVAGFGRHPLLHRDLEEAIDLVFDVAADALGEYQTYKRERGAVDFTDQLALALEALRTPGVQAELAGEIDLVLVDEFQDTNPIQLAIFVELAKLARRSIWVGDQKQAIFGFLQADPALMDAAIEALLGDEPVTLDTSYRSRPELVHLTSAVFAPAFERVGIPSARTILKPTAEQEPDGLGPIVERWHLEGRTKRDRAAAMATGVRDLLADSSVRVRDGEGETRRPRPADIAVLCRRNDECLAIAEELHAIGLSSVVERRGLFLAPEVQLVLAGLRRWADPRDALSAAILARLGAPDGGEEAWLEAALRSPYAGEFSEQELVAVIEARRSAQPAAGLLDALDHVLEAVRAPETAAAWGEASQRLGNLEALRSLALTYLSECAARRVPATIGGFLGWLETVEESEQDGRAQVGGRDAVVVSTFHGAKGLEWPITIVLDQEREHGVTALGVHVAEEDQAFDFEDPLAGRWLRYWPNPFHPSQKTFLHDDLAGHPVTQALEQRERREILRLIYVAWTRAKDRLIVASKPTRGLEKVFERIADDSGPLVREPKEDEVVWAGRGVALQRRTLTVSEPAWEENTGGEVYEAAGPRERPPAYLSPSAQEARGTAGEPERLGERLALSGAPDIKVVGEVLHRFLAADRVESSVEDRQELAREIVARWGIDGNIEAADLVAASDRLRSWIAAKWPGANWHREWPVAHRLADGSVVRGFADLVLELDDGFVVVDHKTFPGGLEAAQERAVEYAGQLGAYAGAIAAATGKRHLGSFIHLPVSGLVVEVYQD